jgi:transposase-like protein
MFSQEIKEKAVSEFLKSGITYKAFCEKDYSYINHKTLERWVHDYKVKKNLIKEYKSVKKSVTEEPITIICYDMDKKNNNPSSSPTPLADSKNSFFNIAGKIQFQSDVLSTYMDLTDVKYSDSNFIILEKIRGLCNEFTV